MSSVDTIITRYISEGFPKQVREFRTLTNEATSAENRLQSFERGLTGFGVAGAGAFALVGAASLKAYGQIQMAEIGFAKSLGSMDKAKAKIEELKEFDRQSPFNFQESVKGAMRLKAVGFEASELKSVLTDIGDAAAGTGGWTDDFMGIGKAIGQMRSKGRISMEEINQLADRNVPALQILQKQLKLTEEELSGLMQGTYTIKSDVGVEALLKGFRELYGGAMMEASKTFPGQVSNLQSAVQQLAAAMGEVAASGTVLGPSIESITGLTDATTELIKNNPGLAKMALGLIGIATASTLALGVGLKVRSVWKEAGEIFKGVAGAKDLLTKATKLDDIAETAKAVTAGREAKALGGVSAASNLSATAAMRLVGANAEAEMAAEAAAKAAGKQTKQLGLLAKMKNLAATPLGTRAMSTIPNLQKGFTVAEGMMGEGGAMSAATWNANKMAAARAGLNTTGTGIGQVSAFGRGGVPLTAGRAAGSMALGAVAGYGAFDDYASMGDDNAAAKGVATGVTAALVSAFVPGGPAIVAITSGLRFAFNEGINRPMERAAEKGNGLDPQSLAGKSNAEKSDLYFKQRDELMKNSSDVGDAASAGSAMIWANTYRKRQKREQDNAWRTKADGEFAEMNAARDEKARLEGRNTRRFSSAPQVSEVTTHDNDARTVTLRLPPTRADRLARERNYNLRTATPSYTM